MTKNSGKLVKLEALRGFAALYVVFHHLFASGLKIGKFDFSFLFRFGQEAVILFFFLSGFVIFYSFNLSRDKSFRTYFYKRFFRIYVPLIIVFGVNFFLYKIYNPALELNFKNLFGNFLMLQDNADKKPNVLFSPFLGNDPLWSLSYEWWFYFMFFAISRRFHDISKADKPVMIFSLIAAISYIFYPNFFNREIMYFSIWWCGLVMGRIYLAKESINFKTLFPSIISIGLITFVLFINFILHKGAGFDSSKIGASPFLEFRHFAFTFFLLLIMPFAKHIESKFTDYIVRFFALIAPVSFVLYISHWFLVYQARYLDDLIPNVSLRTAAYLLICLIFSYIVEKVIYPAVFKIFKTKLKF